MSYFEKFHEYFEIRTAQFETLSVAEKMFEGGNEVQMWLYLFGYAAFGYEAKQRFNTYSEDDIHLLLDGRVPIFIVENPYDDTETP